MDQTNKSTMLQLTLFGGNGPACTTLLKHTQRKYPARSQLVTKMLAVSDRITKIQYISRQIDKHGPSRSCCAEKLPHRLLVPSAVDSASKVGPVAGRGASREVRAASEHLDATLSIRTSVKGRCGPSWRLASWYDLISLSPASLQITFLRGLVL